MILNKANTFTRKLDMKMEMSYSINPKVMDSFVPRLINSSTCAKLISKNSAN